MHVSIVLFFVSPSYIEWMYHTLFIQPPIEGHVGLICKCKHLQSLHARKYKKCFFLLRFLLMSQEPHGLQCSFLCGLGSCGPAVSTGRHAQAAALGCAASLCPHQPLSTCSPRGRRQATAPSWCLWFLRELGQERSRGPWSTECRPALLYQFTPSWDAAVSRLCQATFQASPGVHTRSHPLESSHYIC